MSVNFIGPTPSYRIYLMTTERAIASLAIYTLFQKKNPFKFVPVTHYDVSVASRLAKNI